jgi:asparagine synthase (glutamine-hydrolysing)
MNARLRHRGPDDEGVHVDREVGVALGARRLSIIDVAGGHQPLASEDGAVWAVLNGEIYNHPSLQSQLRDHGHRLATRTDTEVLVHLYEDYGDALVHALEGMYAFAVWDARRRRLLLGRDRFGEKPLFYAERAGGLAFASELTALRAGGGAGDELCAHALDAFFVFGYVPGPDTIVNGVRQVPPAHLLVWDQDTGCTSLSRYWSPPPAARSRPGARGSALEETGELLERSLRSRMIADVPLGVFLSGGVDSTLIAALAARTSAKPVKTFTVGYDVGSVNETDSARRTAGVLGTDHRELVLTEADVAARVPSLLGGLDQPLADQALVSLHAVAELAREEVTVAVGGEGADELFGGYPRYRWLERAEQLEAVVPEGLAGRGAQALRRAPLPGRTRRLADVLEPRPALERHLNWVTDGRGEVRDRLYGRRLRSEFKPTAVLDGLAARIDGPGGTAMERFMRLDQRHWLPDDVLFKADRATMRVSLEMRTPYLQRELAELAAALPVKLHARGGGKHLLRGLLKELLPEGGARRPKTAFRTPAGRWLRGPLAPVLRQQLESGALFSEEWLDRRAVAQLAVEHEQGRTDWTHVLWPVLSLGLWLDAFRAS